MPAERAYVPPMSPAAPPLTADDLLQMHIPDKRVELVRGVLVVREPPGFTHGRVTINLALRLGAYLQSTSAGQVLVTETGFKVETGPDTVRGPDLALVSRDRIPDPEPRGFLDLAPDLVVEVLSPGDRPGEVLGKIGEWLNAGTPLVWIIDAERRLARVYRQDGTLTVVAENGTLDGEHVVPGFSCSLASIL